VRWQGLYPWPHGYFSVILSCSTPNCCILIYIVYTSIEYIVEIYYIYDNGYTIHTMKNILQMTAKKLKVYKHITIRAARSGDNPPAIFPAPQEILKEAGLKIGDNCVIGVDGNKIIIIKENEPEYE
jgi:hypothetical protein